jgi:hypothetical protein
MPVCSRHQAHFTANRCTVEHTNRAMEVKSQVAHYEHREAEAQSRGVLSGDTLELVTA